MALNRLREETKQIRHEIRVQTIGYIVAAFGLVAGLAWNDAIKALIEEFLKQPSQSIIAKFIYAVIITLVVVLLTMYLLRLKGKQDQSK